MPWPTTSAKAKSRSNRSYIRARVFAIRRWRRRFASFYGQPGPPYRDIVRIAKWPSGRIEDVVEIVTELDGILVRLLEYGLSNGMNDFGDFFHLICV